MAGPFLFGRVQETSTTTGTGTYTLAGALPGFQTFAAVGDGNTCPYWAFSVDGNGVPDGGWESGLGTYTASGTTLARTVVYESTNSNNAVNWAAGTRRIILMQPTREASSIFKIEEQTPSGVTVVTFSSLGSYSHLRIVYSARGDQAATSSLINLTFNGDTGSNYDGQRSSFSSTSTLSDQVAQTSAIIGVVNGSTAPASYPSSGVIDIPDYRGTTFFKTALSQTAGPLTVASTTNIFSRIHSAWWRSTAAITSISLTLNGGNYVSGSKFTLYGLR